MLSDEKLHKIDILFKSCPFDIINLDSCFDSGYDKINAFKKLVLDFIDFVAPTKQIRVKKNFLPWVDKEMRHHFEARNKLHALALGLKNKSHFIWAFFVIIRTIVNRYYGIK